MIFPEHEITYVPGKSFECFKRLVVSVDGNELGEPCGTVIVMHGYWWCAQVCPKCLANYWVGGTTSRRIGYDPGAFYPAETARAVRQIIADNNGQYVPTF